MVRVIIIGVGGIANLHAEAIKAILGAELVGGACRTQEKGQAFAERFDCTWHSDYNELISMVAPDMALICTPSGNHLEPCLACCAAGVDVLVDKPLEITVARCDAMIAAAREGGVRLGGIFQSRFSPSLLKLKGAIAEGKFGELALLTGSVPWWREDAYYGEGRWQGTAALDGGGAVINQAIHTIDAVLCLAQAMMPELPEGQSPIASLSAFRAQRAHPSIEVEDTCVVSIRFENGALGSLTATTACKPGLPRRILIGGSEGSVEIVGDDVAHWSLPGDDFFAAGAKEAGGKTGASDPLKHLAQDGFQLNIAAFLASRAPGGPAYPLSGEEMRKSMAVVEAIYASAAADGAPQVPQPLPPAAAAAAKDSDDGANDVKTVEALVAQELAILGGPKAVPDAGKADLFHWPIVTAADEKAVQGVLRAGTMSGLDETRQFERELAEYHGLAHAICYPNGTMALLAGFYAVGLRKGDEIIMPAMTFWASAMPVLQLKATVVWCDVEKESLCMDPADVERKITPKTKAICAVHYAGHPCDMDAIMAIAAKHSLKIVEDVSHAQGALYKGRKVGTFGDAACFSIMSAKSLSAGEGGVLLTDQREVVESAVAFSSYARHSEYLTGDNALAAGIPLGGCKARLNQTCAAMGRVQLAAYDDRCAEIQAAMHKFWKLLEGCPGLRKHHPTDEGSTMGGWYTARGHYIAEELGGLDIGKFCEAVTAEGATSGAAVLGKDVQFPAISPGCNAPLHVHRAFTDVDIYGDGEPTALESAKRAPPGSMPVTEATPQTTCTVPWFKHDEGIAAHAAAFKKVAMQHAKLL